jgi:hypothetical protein
MPKIRNRDVAVLAKLQRKLPKPVTAPRKARSAPSEPWHVGFNDALSEVNDIIDDMIETAIVKEAKKK